MPQDNEKLKQYGGAAATGVGLGVALRMAEKGLKSPKSRAMRAAMGAATEMGARSAVSAAHRLRAGVAAGAQRMRAGSGAAARRAAGAAASGIGAGVAATRAAAARAAESTTAGAGRVGGAMRAGAGRVGGAMRTGAGRVGGAMRTPAGKGVMGAAGLMAAGAGAMMARNRMGMENPSAGPANLSGRRVGGRSMTGRSAVGEVRSKAGSQGLKQAVGYAVSAVQRNEKSGSVGSIDKYLKAMQGSEQYRKLSAADKAKANTALQQWADTQSVFRKKSASPTRSRKAENSGMWKYSDVPFVP